LRTLVLVAVSSALIGGVTGASVALFAASGSPKNAPRSASAPGADRGESSGDAPLEERLANLEQALRVLERRSSPLRSLQGADAGNTASAAPGQRPEETSVVDDPVFEAAVRDVIERAEIDRDNEREVRREDRRKQMATRWADDIAPRLNLNEQQKAKLLEVAQQFMSELGRLWGERDGGAPQSRTERRAEMQRLRQQSEQKLRTILDPNQMRTYESLGDEDKLGFPRRRGGDR
jgi:hypothetical protein